MHAFELGHRRTNLIVRAFFGGMHMARPKTALRRQKRKTMRSGDRGYKSGGARDEARKKRPIGCSGDPVKKAKLMQWKQPLAASRVWACMLEATRTN